MKKLSLLITIAMMILMPSLVSAQTLPTIANRDPALIFSKCLVAEAGYHLNNDHYAIMWVLYRRTTQVMSEERLANLSQNELNVAMARLALRYCNALKEVPPPRTNRWGWAARNARRPWLERRYPNIIHFADEWARGNRVDDPCSSVRFNGQQAVGPAIIWGSFQDARRHHWKIRKRLVCQTTHNVFFDTQNPEN